MSLDTQIALFVDVITDPDPDDAGSTVDALVAKGIDAGAAECLFAFVPTAFVHAAMADTGVTFSPTYQIRDLETGETARGYLTGEPVYVAALAVARQMMSATPAERGRAQDVARCSGEWSALQQLVRDGGGIADCVVGDPLLMRLPLAHITRRAAAAPTHDETQPAWPEAARPTVIPRPRPWWKLW